MMNKAFTNREKRLLARLETQDINIDPTDRWGKGKEHHPKAYDLARNIGALDWMFGDCFGLKFGGDGDNGEYLIYLLDVLFELQDAEKKKE